MKKKKTNKVKQHYKPPKWFSSLIAGSHGSTPAQKKYWKVISDTYRQADWHEYDGRCVSCSKYIEDWRYGHLAHFKRFTNCHAWFKFERRNLALSCPHCNHADDGVVGHAFGEELKRRHGKDVLAWIETENEKYRGQKMEEWQIVERVAELRPDLVDNDLEHDTV